MKKILMLLFVAGVFSLASAQVHLIPHEQDEIQQWFQFSLGRSVDKGFEQNQSFWSVAYNFSYNPFNAFLGVQYTDAVTDLTLEGDWWPLQFDFAPGKLQCGIDVDYHVEWYSDISCEHDITFVPEILYRSKKGFWAGAQVGIGKKMADVYLVKNMISNWNLMLGFSLGKLFANGFEISVDAGTRTLYRRPVFGTAIFTFGAAYTFKNGFRIGTTAEITMRDWVAAAYYMDTVVIGLTGRVSF
ncbi:MAG: hypothetical protein IJS09_03215 [Treponema sp.]|nr:hypothetical protein [Treponema sp.]